MKQEGCLKTLWCTSCHSMSTHQLKSGKWVCFGEDREQHLAGQQAQSATSVRGFNLKLASPWLNP